MLRRADDLSKRVVDYILDVHLRYYRLGLAWSLNR